MSIKTTTAVMLLTVALVLAGPAHSEDRPATTALKSAATQPLLIGAAVSSRILRDKPLAAILVSQFNCITTENEMKPGALEPQPGKFTFDTADRMVDFARTNGLAVIGHNLCWHEQTPDWFYQSPDGKPLPRDQAIANLKRHIDTVMHHFKGKIVGWDVVNEAVSPNAKQDVRDCPARRAIGDDYVETAFRLARDADPDVELYYNDFDIEQPGKRDRALRLIHRLKAAGLRIDAVGIQGHWTLTKPDVKTIEDAIVAFHAEGVKVSITELDIDVLPHAVGGGDLATTQRATEDPYRDGCPATVLQQQADRYKAIFDALGRHRDALQRVTFWGITDRDSWLNNFPVRGRANYPLLWDRRLQPKPALAAVIDSLKSWPRN